MTAGERIKQLRKNAKMSQTALAKALGVSQSTVTNWERNERLPSFDACLKMSKIFNVSAFSLLLDTQDDDDDDITFITKLQRCEDIKRLPGFIQDNPELMGILNKLNVKIEIDDSQDLEDTPGILITNLEEAISIDCEMIDLEFMRDRMISSVISYLNDSFALNIPDLDPDFEQDDD